MSRVIFRCFLLVAFVTGTADLHSADPDPDTLLIRAWQLYEFSTEKQSVVIDTMINYFHIHNPVFRQSVSSSWLGNAGLAVKPNVYDDRGTYPDFIFINHFQPYLQDPLEIKYYNTRRPFSLIDFSTGGPRGKNEKMLTVLHTQNVNPDFNIGFRYFNINSDGQYQQQQAITNAISFFSSYELENYQLHANINLNSARVFENGGLEDENSLYTEDMETEDHAVRLQDARNSIRNNAIFISHSWNPFYHSSRDTLAGRVATWLQGVQLYHVLRYDQYKRTYLDGNPGSGFYPDVFINPNTTFDSVFYRSFTNELMVKLPAFQRGSVSFNAKAGIKNELLRGNYNIYGDTTFHFTPAEPASYLLSRPTAITVIDRKVHKFGSNALIATARGSIGEVFAIWGRGNLFFQGHRQGEYDMQAGIRFDFFGGKNRSVIDAQARQRETTPSLFLNSFESNHFAWENDFRRTGESSISGSIRMPERGFDAGISFHLLNNHIYFDHTANPRQYSDIFPVMNVSVKKDINLWKLHFRNIIKYQVSGNQDILPLPDLSLYQSTWFEQSLIRDILNMQVGFDIYYTTEYQGYAYQPATSQFFLQDERSFGNYPYIDLFLNFKHKRTRVFFKAGHINAGQMEREYFTVLHYPRNELMLKFGLSWSFYN